MASILQTWPNFYYHFLLPVRMQLFILCCILDISLNFVVTWNLTFHSGGRRYFGFIWSPTGIYNFLDFNWNLYSYSDTKKGSKYFSKLYLNEINIKNLGESTNIFYSLPSLLDITTVEAAFACLISVNIWVCIYICQSSAKLVNRRQFLIFFLTFKYLKRRKLVNNISIYIYV